MNNNITFGLSFFIIASVMLFGFSFNQEAFATHTGVTIETRSGSSIPGCELTDRCFTPSTVTVGIGDVITFTNPTAASHTITAGTPNDGPSGEFDTGFFYRGGSFQYTPIRSGEIPYYCMVHPWKVGLIIVEGEDTPLFFHINDNYYSEREPIIVSGGVIPVVGQTSVLLEITFNGNYVSNTNVGIRDSGYFLTSFSPKETIYWQEAGEYVIRATYGDETVHTTFFYNGFISPEPPTNNRCGPGTVFNADVNSCVLILPTPLVTTPHAINDLTTISGDGQVTLSWTAPNNGGSPLTHYYVDWFVLGIEKGHVPNINPTATTLTITGLTNGLVHQFALIAVNSVGISENSDWSSGTPTIPIDATKPHPPNDLTVIAGNSQVTLSWSEPNNGGTPITAYYVWWFDGNNNKQSTYYDNSNGQTIIITGLINGEEYRFKVASINGIGWSNASNEVFVTPN